jgi:lipopolysaccharide transport system ATP-binding protein
MINDFLVNVAEVNKKFCRRLRQSLWYGVKDLCSEIIGKSNDNRGLRKNEFWAAIGLIGPNGSGKTTLLRLINGIIKPDKGFIEINGRMQALIALGAGFNPILTGRENIYVNAAVLGISKSVIKKRFDEIVDFSGIEEFIDTPLQSYSSGMAVRLGFAVAAHMDPDILLVDEVLAVGDEGFQRKCLNKIGDLKNNGTGIILVSHNMHTISTFTEKVLLIKEGTHKLFLNVYDGVKEYKEIFADQNNTDIQKICNGNDKINFYKIDIRGREFHPGDSFDISLCYESTTDFNDIQIDTRIICTNDTGTYFQAINKAYDRNINLQEGKHIINITVENIQINNTYAIISFAIWTKQRTELLFWWKIPIKFTGVDYATGNNFLNISYDIN